VLPSAVSSGKSGSEAYTNSAPTRQLMLARSYLGRTLRMAKFHPNRGDLMRYTLKSFFQAYRSVFRVGLRLWPVTCAF